jgi:hypothetical protein
MAYQRLCYTFNDDTTLRIIVRKGQGFSLLHAMEKANDVVLFNIQYL